MPLRLERIDWMPSPPLAPDDGPIDFAHLSRMTLGDGGLEREVLVMFSAQSARLVGRIAALAADAGALAHTLKGSARAIGAFAVADAASRFEGTREWRRYGRTAHRTRQGGGAGADGDRGHPAAGLIHLISERIPKTGLQVFLPSAGACGTDPL